MPSNLSRTQPPAHLRTTGSESCLVSSMDLATSRRRRRNLLSLLVSSMVYVDVVRCLSCRGLCETSSFRFMAWLKRERRDHMSQATSLDLHFWRRLERYATALLRLRTVNCVSQH